MLAGPSMGWSRSHALLGVCLAVALCLTSAPGVAAAQSAADREGAATAFDRGTAAYLAHDYARAAQWFETAYGLAPSSAALIQTIRANNRAGDLLRAASLALRIPALYAAEPAAMRVADEVIGEATPLYVRVDVTCASECNIELDGGLMSFASFFVEPGADHAVRANFETGAVDATVNGAAGETRTLSFEAPPAPIVAVDEGGDGSGDGGGGTDTGTPSSGGISPAFFATGVVLTALAGGGLVGSAIYMYDGVPAYQMDPTAARLADGQSRELVTNAMIGVTSGLAATTVLLAIFTDWDGDPAPSDAAPSSPPVAASIGVSPDGATATVWGSF